MLAEFDSTLVIEAWFDDSSLLSGWFDSDLIESAGPSNRTLTPALLSNSAAFYAPTVVPGAVSLDPSLFTSASNAFYAPALASS